MRKKGRMDFLYDKFKRIGVPLTLWSFIFGPLVIMMVVGASWRGSQLFSLSFAVLVSCLALAELLLLLFLR